MRVRGSVGFGFAVALLSAYLAFPVAADPITPREVPEPLRPWIGWVLRDVPEAGCPYASQGEAVGAGGVERASSESRPCAWITSVELIVEDPGAAFRQRTSSFNEGWIELPGDLSHWPEEVQLDGKPIAVVERTRPGSNLVVPEIRVLPGSHRIVGRFRWDRRPEVLAIPAATALIGLQIDGAEVPFPVRPNPGQLRLGTRPAEPNEADALEVDVHRRLSDGVPCLLETRIRLGISGSRRELVFASALPVGFVPMELSSELPARVDSEGRLRVDGRAGRFEVRLVAHRSARELEVQLGSAGEAWDSSEVWSFQDAPALRWVEVEGVPSVDPQQTEMPREWRNLPAFLVQPGDTLRLVERRRAGSEPTPDRLELARTLWLDFDGRGYTLQDHIRGSLGSSDRLEISPRLDLGRVSLDGADQPITRRAPELPEGIEVRSDTLDIEADARIELGEPATRAEGGSQGNRSRSSLPAVGWNADFTSALTQLRLPPGWRAVYVSGPDGVSGSWIDGWTLLDLFLVLITAVAIGQLMGKLWGAAALVALGLTFPEQGAPQLIWLLGLGTQALSRVVRGPKLLRVLQTSRVAVALTMALIAIPFAVQQAQQSLYPALETRSNPSSGRMLPIDDEAVPDQLRKFPESEAARSPEPLVLEEQPAREGRAERARTDLITKPDPNALAATGMGVPNWSWHQVQLEWTGPISRDASFRPFLLPPLVNRALGLVRVVAIALLFALSMLGASELAGLMGRIRTRGIRPRGGGTPPGSTGSALLCALGLGSSLLVAGSPSSAAADFPPQAQLEELRRRLTEPPSCLPQCANVPRLRIDLEPSQLLARLEIDAAAATAVALPGSLDSFVPTQVTVDTDSAPALRRNSLGQLVVKLDPGRHQVLLVGALPDQDTLEIPLPLPPKQIDVAGSGWEVAGLRAEGRATKSLKLVRTRPAGDPEGPHQEAEARDTRDSGRTGNKGIPGFVRVTRSLRLGISWQIDTRIDRLSPTGQPLVLRVPLLAGESVTDRSIEVKDGQAEVSFDAQGRSISWTSDLATKSPIELRAPTSGSWVETWAVRVAPLWHLESQGIPTTGNIPSSLHIWRPWPGEELRLELTRPVPSPGQSRTIDWSQLRVSPGARASESQLSMQVRASRADRTTLTLPSGSELTEIRIDGEDRPLRPVGDQLEIPLRPGVQKIEASWRTPSDRGLDYATPGVDLGTASVNHDLRLIVPRDRWVLWVGGPLLGPAVRFWGMLGVAAVIAAGLGRAALTPLGAGAWFLLFVGLTQIHLAASALIVAWLLGLGLRKRWQPEHPLAHDLLQLGLIMLGLAAGSALLSAISTGLLGSPEMQIIGNGSNGRELHWYLDRAGPVPESGWVLWLPIWIYRLAMLGWALWIAQALLRWLRWAWECMSEGGWWRPVRTRLRRD